MSSTQSNSYTTTKQTLKSTLRKGTFTNTTKTKTTGPYNRNFQQLLIDNGIYPDGYEDPDDQTPPQPANWEEINRRLAQPRPSLSPSQFLDDEFRKFRREVANAAKEKQVTTSVIPFIEGNSENARCVSGGIPFTNLDPLINGTLTPGNPDIYYGARPEQLDRRVRNELGGYIIPSTQDNLPIAPNFFLAAKGPDGSLAVAGRQVSYDGALGARGMRSLQSYGREDAPYFNKAYTLTSLYHGGTLKMFTIYPSQPTSSGSQPKYFIHQLNAWCITGNIETFRQGATYYRNGRDWAKEQRDEAIRWANEKVNEDRAKALAINTSFAQASSFASEASSDMTYTIKASVKKARISRTEESNTNTQTSQASSNKPLIDHRVSTKRSRDLSKSPQRPQRKQRKRRNAGDSDDDSSQ
ncbi:hypothetical protein MMC25_008181 [Agyrium rufum]|nr:hypothetical protein [Agyrium rufum]